MSNHSEEYLELVAETKTLTKELTELSNKARIRIKWGNIDWAVYTLIKEQN